MLQRFRECGGRVKAHPVAKEIKMTDFHKIWIDQCDAARRIQEDFGTEKAIGYLIGEKLVEFVRASDTRPEFATELPQFVLTIKEIFRPAEIREYLESIHRVGPLAHIGTDEEVEMMRDADMLDDDPVLGAEEILIVERIKEKLLS